MATVQDEIDRLKNDVGTYVTNMRSKVTSLQDQINNLTGQVATAASDQMASDVSALDAQLTELEANFAQDNPPAGPSDGNTGGTPAARR